MGCYPISVTHVDFTKMYNGYSNEGEEIKAKPLIEHLRSLDPKLLTDVEIRDDGEVHVTIPDGEYHVSNPNVLLCLKQVKETK